MPLSGIDFARKHPVAKPYGERQAFSGRFEGEELESGHGATQLRKPPLS